MPQGIAPPDPTTLVGQVRLIGGDSAYTELDPPVPGVGEYVHWSDAEIEAALLASGDSVFRALSLLYTNLAAYWNSNGATIKTDDLTYSVKDSVGSWLALVKHYSDLADAEEERLANDYFDLVEVGSIPDIRHPELAQWPVNFWRA